MSDCVDSATCSVEELEVLLKEVPLPAYFGEIVSLSLSLSFSLSLSRRVSLSLVCDLRWLFGTRRGLADSGRLPRRDGETSPREVRPTQNAYSCTQTWPGGVKLAYRRCALFVGEAESRENSRNGFGRSETRLPRTNLSRSHSHDL